MRFRYSNQFLFPTDSMSISHSSSHANCSVKHQNDVEINIWIGTGNIYSNSRWELGIRLGHFHKFNSSSSPLICLCLKLWQIGSITIIVCFYCYCYASTQERTPIAPSVLYINIWMIWLVQEKWQSAGMCFAGYSIYCLPKNQNIAAVFCPCCTIYNIYILKIDKAPNFFSPLRFAVKDLLASKTEQVIFLSCNDSLHFDEAEEQGFHSQRGTSYSPLARD